MAGRLIEVVAAVLIFYRERKGALCLAFARLERQLCLVIERSRYIYLADAGEVGSLSTILHFYFGITQLSLSLKHLHTVAIACPSERHLSIEERLTALGVGSLCLRAALAGGIEVVARVGVCYISDLPCSHVELQEHVLAGVGNGSVGITALASKLNTDLLIVFGRHKVEIIPIFAFDRSRVGKKS